MKNSLFHFSAIVLFLSSLSLSSCGDSVAMGYDEATTGAILEKDPGKSPEENVKQYLLSTGVVAQDISILAKGGQKCGCTKGGKSCYCQLSNAPSAGHHCSDMESGVCTKEKYVVVKVLPEDAEKLKALGFSESGM